MVATPAAKTTSKSLFNAPDYISAGALTSAAKIESAGDDTDSGRINFSSTII